MHPIDPRYLRTIALDGSVSTLPNARTDESLLPAYGTVDPNTMLAVISQDATNNLVAPTVLGTDANGIIYQINAQNGIVVRVPKYTFRQIGDTITVNLGGKVPPISIPVNENNASAASYDITFPLANVPLGKYPGVYYTITDRLGTVTESPTTSFTLEKGSSPPIPVETVKLLATNGGPHVDYNFSAQLPCNWVVVYGPANQTFAVSANNGATVGTSTTNLNGTINQITLDSSGIARFWVAKVGCAHATSSCQVTVGSQSINVNFGLYTLNACNSVWVANCTGAPADGITHCDVYLQASGYNTVSWTTQTYTEYYPRIQVNPNSGNGAAVLTLQPTYNYNNPDSSGHVILTASSAISTNAYVYATNSYNYSYSTLPVSFVTPLH